MIPPGVGYPGNGNVEITLLPISVQYSTVNYDIMNYDTRKKPKGNFVKPLAASTEQTFIRHHTTVASNLASAKFPMKKMVDTMVLG